MSPNDASFEARNEKDRSYIESSLRADVDAMFDAIAPVFLGESAEDLRDHFEVEIINRYEEKGRSIPTAQYDSVSGNIKLIIEPNSILSYAANLAEGFDGEVEESDLVSVIIGVGVARIVIGYKMTQLDLASDMEAEYLIDQLSKKDYLWEEAAQLDDAHGFVDTSPVSSLRESVARMSDDQILRVNMLRFAVAASLQYSSYSPDAQQALVELQREELMDIERARNFNLNLNLGWLELESAFELYNDALSEFAYAFSFPMSLAELQQFMDYGRD